MGNQKPEMGNQKPEVEEKPTTQWPKEKGQTLIYKTLHRKLKIEQHESHKKGGVNWSIWPYQLKGFLLSQWV
jgi:hypothetical protein